MLFYFNNKNCIISKILLSSYKNNIKWYNDITNLKKKPLFYLLVRLKDDLREGRNLSSHINNNDTNTPFTIEIFTLNKDNITPLIKTKDEVLECIYLDWMGQS